MATPSTQSARRVVTLPPQMASGSLGVMNILNEVTAGYPQAISLAPGRPRDGAFDIRAHRDDLDAYVAEARHRSGESESAIWARLCQYGCTNGLIQHVVAQHLACDEHVEIDGADIMITVGAQEAMAVALLGLFEPRRDVLLTSQASYIGVTGMATLLGIRVVPIDVDDDGLIPAQVERAIKLANRDGRARALYDVPDFNNPLGSCLPLPRRLELLQICRAHDVTIIEDNAYGMYAYDHERLPTLKALDRDGQVLYIGSFSKTLCPGLRLGYLAGGQELASGERLIDALSRVKSLLTVNSSPICQAIVAGRLLRMGGSLEPIVAEDRSRYRLQRDAMVGALQRAFAGVRGVRWTIPAGGFFLPVRLPFEFGESEMQRCAADNGVIVMPMTLFCPDGTRRNEVRLAFSYVEPPVIVEGIRRFSQFVRAQMQRAAVDHEGAH